MVATSPGHHYGTRSKGSQEQASQSPRKSGATAPKGGKRKPTVRARSSGAFSKRPPPVKPTAAPPGDSVLLVGGVFVHDHHVARVTRSQLLFSLAGSDRNFTIDRMITNHLWETIAKCKSQDDLKKMALSVARDGAPWYTEDDDVVCVEVGYREKASNTQTLSFLGPNDVCKRLDPSNAKTNTIHLYAKFTVGDCKPGAGSGSKRSAAAAPPPRKKQKLTPGVTSTASGKSGKSLSRSYGLGGDEQGTQNMENMKQVLKQMHGKKKYDDALYKKWAELINWREANADEAPMGHPAWKTVEQTLAAQREGARVPPSDRGHRGGAATFKSAFPMPGGGVPGSFGGAGVFGGFGGAPGVFGAAPGGFGAGFAYPPQTPFYQQMPQQHMPQGFPQQMPPGYPQQMPYYAPAYGFNPAFSPAPPPPPPPPQNPGGIPGFSAPGVRGGGAGPSQHHEDLSEYRTMSLNERLDGFEHGQVLEKGQVVYVTGETNMHYMVFVYAKNGSGERVFLG